MDIRKMLVLTGDDPASCPALSVALALGRLLGAGVTALHSSVWREPSWVADAATRVPPGPGKGGRRPAAEALDAAFQERCAAAGIAGTWLEDRGDPVERLAAHSLYADLVVAERGNPAVIDGTLTAPEAGRLALTVAPSLLIVPPGYGREFAPGRVLVAWNRRREAARAIRGALPLLCRARQPVLLSVYPPGWDDRPDQRIADHLAAHGVQADVRINFAAEFEAPGAILAQAHALDADLIVMGAYGHSRSFETVLGGVTRHMLENADLPVWTCH